MIIELDAVRTATKILNINNTNAEGTDSQGLTAFGTDGFQLAQSGNDEIINNGDKFCILELESKWFRFS